MDIDELVAGIRRIFAYLFEDYGFEVVFTSASGPDDREMIVGLENGCARLKFYAEASIAISFADSDAPFDRDDPETPRWLRLSTLKAFLEESTVDWGSDGSVSTSSLIQLSRILHPRIDMILKLLNSKPDWIDAFRRFEKAAETSYWQRLGR